MNSKCYVIAPYGFNLGELRSLMQDMNIEFFTSEECLQPGLMFIDAMKEAIEQASFILVVYDSTISHTTWAFEFGYASSNEKPILVLTEEATPELPLFILKYPVATLSQAARAISNYIDIGYLKLKNPIKYKKSRGFFLKQHIKSAPIHTIGIDNDNGWFAKRQVNSGKFTSKRIKDTTRTYSKDTDSYIDRVIKNMRDEPDKYHESDMVSVVCELLQAANIDRYKIVDKNIRAYDIVFWSNELGNIFSNPIIIELKKAISSILVGRKIVNQIRKYMFDNSIRTTIVLYANGVDSTSINNDLTSHGIIFVSFSDIVENGAVNFVKLLRERRNQLAHG